MNTRENCNLIAAADRIRYNEAEADRIGQNLATTLHLKRDRDHKDRWVTDWGTKTNAGLARTIIAQLEAA